MYVPNRIRKFARRVVRVASTLLFPWKYFFYSKKVFAHHQLSFSQEGEDMILSRLFEVKKFKRQAEHGFFVDVGAHHPQRFSNTYRFYLKGWNGINIDALPGSMKVFDVIRPSDINIEAAVSDRKAELIYYQFDEPALNTFSQELAEYRKSLPNYQFIREKKIITQRLEDLLDKYLSKDQVIDFMSVDVEGLDLNVLQSNNWAKYKPRVVMVEDLQKFALAKIETSLIVAYLEEQGYELYAKAVCTLIFCQKD